MKLLAVYAVLLTAGEFGAFLVGREVEIWSPGWSLTVFLSIFFLMFWAAWRVAVKIA